MSGNVTWRKVCQPLAPRSAEASCTLGDRRRSLATTLLKASTMQNVPWPMTTVVKPRSHPSRMKVLRSATPVTMPGRAMGSTMRNDRELRPKNL